MEELKNEKFNWLQWLPAIISALMVGLTAWFTYNQTTHDKMTDLKIETIKKQEMYKMNEDNENAAKINGALWLLLSNLNCDRVYIIQPHPPRDQQYLSVSFEVRRPGVSSLKDIFKNIPMQDIPVTVETFAKTDFINIKDIENSNDIDIGIKARFAMNGEYEVAVIKLVDSRGVWIGNLIADNGEDRRFQDESIINIMLQAARKVQILLPSYNP